MADDEAPPSGSSDFLKMYVIGGLLLSAVLGYFLWKANQEKKAYEDANATARAIFGSAESIPPPSDQRPNTIRGLAVGVEKFLATYKEATFKATDGGPDIPMKTIEDRAGGLNLQVQSVANSAPQKNAAKRYEEVASTITLKPTDLEHLAKFLFNIESTSTRFRIIDFRWELRPDKDNPYSEGAPSGHLITAPQIKIGFRRPITGR